MVDPMVAGLGEVVWIVDLNRQSLDRVVPGIAAHRLQGMFAAAGWQVITVKYGTCLQDLFARPGGSALRGRINAMTNPEYQRLLRLSAADLRKLLPGTGEEADLIRSLLTDVPDEDLLRALRNLGGHDHEALASSRPRTPLRNSRRSGHECGGRSPSTPRRRRRRHERRRQVGVEVAAHDVPGR
ncbi:hypothetical protein O1Q96_23895 [Streptomyces sp. Qhu-G9]|uniref:hypothetical protein n=1 Tax=Streptomyces sp. Qhu-G9 TaxID=3452799 RepID=UPI0022AC485E|nr:hypothetical protein [Streptomyces aurantiacus]WAU82517.1 hypothetical protein O1Q96_23895 [Streptomyces aurantiacus]